MPQGSSSLSLPSSSTNNRLHTPLPSQPFQLKMGTAGWITPPGGFHGAASSVGKSGRLMCVLKIVPTRCFSPLSWPSWAWKCSLHMGRLSFSLFLFFVVVLVAMIKLWPIPIWGEKGLFHLRLYSPSLRNTSRNLDAGSSVESWRGCCFQACILCLVQLFLLYSPILRVWARHYVYLHICIYIYTYI